MGAFSIWHWIIVLIVVLVLFGGKGKISGLMGDFGKGLRSFKKGMKDDDLTEIKESPDDLQKLQKETLKAVKQGVSDENSSS